MLSVRENVSWGQWKAIKKEEERGVRMKRIGELRREERMADRPEGDSDKKAEQPHSRRTGILYFGSTASRKTARVDHPRRSLPLSYKIHLFHVSKLLQVRSRAP